MEKTTSELLDEILAEAEKGIVELKTNDLNSSWRFYVQFLTNEKKPEADTMLLPVLKFPNREVLISKLDEYLPLAEHFYRHEKDYWCLDDTNFRKKLIFDIFVNSTPSDFENIYSYIDHRKQMIQNKCSKKLRYLGSYLGYDVYGEISKCGSNLEAPYKMKIFLSDEKESFTLPKITFGFDNNKNVHVYSIQNKKNLEKTPIFKKLDRHFRAVNKNIDPEDDIAKVSPSALVAFTIFATYMEDNGIKNFKFHSYMPLRYQVHFNQAYYQTLDEEEATNAADKIEYNAVNKFINCAQRFCHHFPNSTLDYEDYNNTLSLVVDTHLEEHDKQNPELAGNIIYDIAKIVENCEEELSSPDRF